MDVVNLDSDERDIIARVKSGGEVYDLMSPTVDVIVKHNKMLKDGVDELDCTMYLISEMGLPKEIVGSLTVDKLTKLSDGMAKRLSEKK